MTKKGGTKRPQATLPHSSSSLRLETTGKLTTTRNSKSLLKLEQLQNIATWASKEASIPSLAAFFGHQFATAAEALGTPPDPSLVCCERCETILEPGLNCTVRIQRTRGKARHRRKKFNFLSKNMVVYKCHFCSHWNQKKGTSEGHMKELCPPKLKPCTKPEASKSMLQKCGALENGTSSQVERAKLNELGLPPIFGDASFTNSPQTPVTPILRTAHTLLDTMKRKRNKTKHKKSEESENKLTAVAAESSASASRKRRKKSWTSLKEIVESNERERSQKIINLTKPLFS